jgi:uncharacterized protein GlcG (DUF336 family)
MTTRSIVIGANLGGPTRNPCIGAIGVSGGTADQDETCAQAGIEAAKDALK